MAAPMMTANGVHRRPSLFDISNITPPPTKVSHFSDPLYVALSSDLTKRSTVAQRAEQQLLGL